MKSFDSEAYLRKSSEEANNERTSFGVSALPKAKAHGGFFDAAGALFRQNNIIISTVNDKLHRYNRFYEYDPSFNPLEHIPPGEAQFSYKYLDAKNLDEIRDIFYQHQDEIRDRELYADKPLESFFLGFIAANADPSALIPGTLFYKNFYKRLSDAKRAAWVGGTLGSQTVAQEWALRKTQIMRTPEESAYNILASTVIGASIGAFSGKFLNSPEGRRAVKETAQILEDGDITPPGVAPGPGGPRPRPGSEGGLVQVNPLDANYPIGENALNPIPGLPEGIFHGTPRKLDVNNLRNMDENAAIQINEELSEGSVVQTITSPGDRRFRGSNSGIYGRGLYTTQVSEVAQKYTKKGQNLAKKQGEYQPTVYKIWEKQPVKLKDIDIRINEDKEFTDIFRNITSNKTLPKWVLDAIGSVIIEKGKPFETETMTGFMNFLRRWGVKNKISVNQYQDFLRESIMYPLAEKGYRGFTHLGGVLTKQPKKHNVNIYWYPRDDLEVFEYTTNGGDGNVPPGPTSTDFAAPGGKSVGAANVMEMALQGQALKMGKKTAKAFGTTLAKLTPAGRLATSQLGYIRLAGQQLFENNWRYQKNSSFRNEEGQEVGFQPNAIALETLIKRDMGKVTSLLMELDNLYFEQRGIKATEKMKTEKDYFVGKGLNRDEFSDAAFFDVIDGFVDQRENVGKAAKLMHEFFEYWKDKYTELRVFPEGMTVRNSINYFSHYYNVPWIQDPRNRPQAEKILIDYYKEVNSLVEANIDSIKAFLKASKAAKRLLKKQTKVEKEHTTLKAKQEKLSLDKIIDDALNQKVEALAEELKAGTPEQVKKAIDQANKLFRDSMPQEIFDANWKPRTFVMDDDQIWVSAQNTLDNIQNLNSTRFSNQYISRMGIGGTPRPTNHRALMIPTKQIAPMLIRDYRKVLPMFGRAMIPNYHITKFAQDNSFDESDADVSVAGAPGQVVGGLMSLAKEELDMMLRGADEKQAKALYDAFTQGHSDIKAALELLLGIFGNGYNTNDTSFAKFSRVMSAYNYTKMMGYMVVSALTDPGVIVLRNGYAGLHEGVLSIANHMKGAKYNKELMQSIGKATEVFTGYRLKAYADQNDLVGSPGKLTKAFEYLVTRFGNLSLMSPWTDYMQMVTANAYLGELLRSTVGYGKNLKKLEEMIKSKDELLRQLIPDTEEISKREKEIAEFKALPDETRSKYLALGIQDKHFKILYEQWSKIGGIEDDVFWLDWGAWEMNSKEKIDALEVIQAALVKEIDSTIIIPGLGDKPLFARTDVGTLMLQFKSFSFGATSKIVVSGLTHQDSNFYNGILLLLFLGAMNYTITSLLKGKEIDTSIENMAFEAIDRSGLLGILMEVPLIAQKMGFLPGMGTTRYQSRDWVGALGGPTLGTLSDWVTLMNKYKNADEEPLRVSDFNKTWRQVPANNLWYLDGLNRNFGITNNIALGLGFEENK